MIRAFRLTGLCLAIFGGLLVTKVVSAPAPEPAAAAGKPATKASAALQDTLMNADKFTVVYLVRPAENAPLLATQTEPIKAAAKTSVASPDRPALAAKKMVFLLPKPRPRIKSATTGNGADRPKSASDIKTCRQKDAIADFLISAGIAPQCES